MYNDNDFITVLKVKTIHIGFHSKKTDLNQISKVTYEKTFKIVIQGNQDHSHLSVVRPLKKPLNGQCSRIVEFACDVLFIYLSEPLKVKVKQIFIDQNCICWEKLQFIIIGNAQLKM